MHMMNCRAHELPTVGNSSIRNGFRTDELPGNSLMAEITRRSGRRSLPVSQGLRRAQPPGMLEVRGAQPRSEAGGFGGPHGPQFPHDELPAR